MPKKILIVGDIHFRDKRLEDIAEAWNRLITHAHDKKYDLIACAGDVFDHVNVAGKERTVGTIYDAFLSPFLRRDEKIPTALIFGNHDIGDAMEKDALYPLEGCPWICVLRRPGVKRVMGGLSICALPWTCREATASKLASSKGISRKESEEQAEAAIRNLPDRLRAECKEHTDAGDFVLFLGHLEVTGATRDNGMVQANGAFEFDPLTLSSIGAHAYGLGHIHKRQSIPGLPNKNDGYLGTLCQLSFGEQDNWVGARSMVIDGQSVMEDNWLENSRSPKYVTVDTLDDLKTKPNDHVKLRAEERPENLPVGVVFEKAVATKEREERPSLSADAPISDLLAAWKESSKCDVPLEKLCSGEQSLQSELGAQGDAIGSLDSIDAVTLDNMTCHEHVRVDFPKGVTAIEGPNGSGKTTLVEAPIVAMYGKTPSRPSVASLVSQGKQEGRLEVEFRSGGKKYTVSREVKLSLKSSSSRAFLKDADGEVIAGPKVEEVEKKCAALVGDVDMVMSGIFSPQGDSGGLIDAPRAERKELFAKLLGTHRLIEMSAIAKKRAQAEDAAAQGIADMSSRIKDGLSTEADDAARLEECRATAATVSEEIKKLKGDLATAQETLAIAERANKDRRASILEKERLEAKRGEIAAKARALKAKLEELGDVDASDVEKRVAKARRSETDLAKVEAEIAKHESMRSASLSEASRIKSEAEKVEGERVVSHAQARVEASKKVEESRKERAEARRKLDEVRQDTAIKLEKLRGKLEEAKRKVELLSGFPDADICNSCSFAKDGLEHRAKIPDYERAIPRGEAILAKADEQIKSYDEETERIAGLLGRVPDVSEWQPEMIEKAKALREEADQKEKDIPEVPKALMERREKAREGCASLKELEGELERAKGAKDEAAKLSSSIAELKGNFDEVDRMVKEVVIPEAVDESAPVALARSLSEDIRGKEAALNEASKSIGQWEARAGEHARRKEELKELEGKRLECEERSKVMSALAQAFGRDGIPQIIVDGALPRFQEIMSGLLAEFGKGWDIQVRSQRTTKSGTVQEAIDIMVDSGFGERDIATYSGGEKKILKSVVRIGFATLQAERTGKGLKVLVMDEATDHMDDENAEVMVRMLGKLACFNQVILISHHTRVLGEIISKIRL